MAEINPAIDLDERTAAVARGYLCGFVLGGVFT